MSQIYESDKILAEYLLFHYGSDKEILPAAQNWPDGMRRALGFPIRTTTHFSNSRAGRGLDLGCAVGRSTFEMARACQEVIGVDFSHAFIAAANQLKKGQSLDFLRLEEAAHFTQLTASLPNGIDPTRVEFTQGDAMNLPEIGSFDRVHAANLLCRLPEPVRLLARLPQLVRPQGELVLATPCTWLEEFTPSPNWPLPDTLEWLKHHLAPHFTLLRETEEPFLIRETARKFQWTRSLVTVWQRKPQEESARTVSQP